MATAREDPHFLKQLTEKHQGIKAKMSSAQFAQFSKLPSNISRMQFALGKKNQISKAFEMEFEYEGKSDEKSCKIRLEGNDFFKKKKFREALKKYNLSVLYAEKSSHGTMKQTVTNGNHSNNIQNGHNNVETVTDDNSNGVTNHEAVTSGNSNDLANQEEALAMAIANRSAALYHLKHFAAAILDVDYAVNEGYPTEMVYKLLDRKGKCQVQLKMFEDAKTTFSAAKTLLGSVTDLDEKGKQFWTELFDKQIEQCQAKGNQNDAKSNPNFTYISPKHLKPVPELTGARSEKYIFASDSFSINKSANAGRYAVATKDIQVGDVVLAEPPYSCILYPEYYKSHCFNCIKSTVAMIPCRQCAGVGYCSTECEEKAWQQYHRIECKYLSWLDHRWMGRLGHLAARLTIQNLLEGASSSSKEGVNGSTEVEGEEEEVYRDTYDRVSALVGHENARDGNTNLQFCIMAVLVVRILQHAHSQGAVDLKIYTADSSSGTQQLQQREEQQQQQQNQKNQKNQQQHEEQNQNHQNEQQQQQGKKRAQHDPLVELGALILSHLQVVQCNGYAVIEMQQPQDFRLCKPGDIGLGIYTTLSLMNHSCNPNVDVACYGHYNVVKATMNIAKGEKINMDYGPVFVTSPLVERHETLSSHYFFICQCEACVQGWPMFDDIENKVPTFKCENCRDVQLRMSKKMKCPKCKKVANLMGSVEILQQSHESYAEAMNDAIGGDFESALPRLQEHLSLMQRLLWLPWRDFYSCQATIKQCFRMQGNCNYGIKK